MPLIVAALTFVVVFVVVAGLGIAIVTRRPQ